MAIVKIQQPDEERIYVHQDRYPTYYTASSNQSTVDDFKYRFKLYTEDGLISTTKNPPYITNSIGVYNPNSILQNLFEVDFNPDIITWTAVEDFMYQYTVKVDEFYNSATGATATYEKYLAIHNSVEDWNYSDYVLNSNTKKMLSNQDNLTLEFGLNDTSTKRFLNGVVRKGNYTYPASTTYNSLAYEISLIITRAGVKYYYRNITTNPYFNQASTPMSTNNNIFDNITGKVLDIPVGPSQINDMFWSYVAYDDGTSFVPIAFPYPIYESPLQVGDKYVIQTYTWPYGTNGMTSQEYNFEVVEECPHRERINISWECRLGGFDNFIFDRKFEKTNNISRSNFRKTRDSLGANYSNFMGHTDYDRGQKTFNTDIDTHYNVTSDWLNDEEILYLEDMFYSENVYAKIDGTWYPIILDVDNVKVGTTTNELRNYDFSFSLSNKKYI